MVNSSAASERMPAARDGVVFSVRDPLYRVLAIGLAGCIIGADSLNNLLPRVVQCVAEWGTSPSAVVTLGYSLSFLYPFARLLICSTLSTTAPAITKRVDRT